MVIQKNVNRNVHKNNYHLIAVEVEVEVEVVERGGKYI